MKPRVTSLLAAISTLAVVGGVRSSESPPAALSDPDKVEVKVEVITNSIGMKLARIPAGKFSMGSPRGETERNAGETRHEITLTRSFHMGVHEVTQAQFARVMGGEAKAFFGKNRGGGPDHPMDSVLWKDAEKFCEKLSARPEESRSGRKYRLPTEAEWEFACRAGTTTPFHFGDSLSSGQANFNGQYPYGEAEKGPYLRKTAEVGSYRPNSFGLHDMHGNVAEWCADWYDPEYYADSPEEDPLGPPFGVVPDDYGNFYVVVRGGCWLDEARACRSAYRFRAMHRNRYRLIGFRVVCEVETQEGR